nr:baseplate J/gp47 family protein [Clostridium sp. YIM B02500]
MLSNISNEYNKSEGEIMYDAEKPVAIELENAYTIIERLPNVPFADTAEGKDLDKVVNKFGVYRKETTQSGGQVKIIGIPGSNINKGESVSSDSIPFVFTDTLTVPANGIAYVNVKCTKYGSIGNIPIGAIKYLPKTLAGLQTVTNLQAFSNGYDEEDDESLRNRYYAKIQNPVTTANANQFKNWALEVTGVGDAKVIPLWNGAGTVKVLIINSNKTGADSTLVQSVQNHIDPNQNGDGAGTMPLSGAICTVASATEKAINISVTVQTNLDALVAKTNIENAVKEYLKEIAFQQNYVSYAFVGDKILNADGITDYSNLLLNGVAGNVAIANTEVAVLGAVTLG